MERSTMNSVFGFTSDFSCPLSVQEHACPKEFKRTTTTSQLTALVRSQKTRCYSGSEHSQASDHFPEDGDHFGVYESEHESDHEHSQTDFEFESESNSSHKTGPIAIPLASCTSLRKQHEAVKKMIYAQQVYEMKRAAYEYHLQESPALCSAFFQHPLSFGSLGYASVAALGVLRCPVDKHLRIMPPWKY
eukprot:gene3255-13279_t